MAVRSIFTKGVLVQCIAPPKLHELKKRNACAVAWTAKALHAKDSGIDCRDPVLICPAVYLQPQGAQEEFVNPA
jgi:hypothetical protein